MSRDEVGILRSRLAQARRRLEAEMPYSPSWAALAEWVEEIEREIAAADEPPVQDREAMLISA